MRTAFSIPPHLESLWIWSPSVLTATLIDELRAATCDIDGIALGIPQSVVDGAREGRPVDAVEYADRLFDSVAAFPSYARRVELSALVLLPTAYRKSGTSCRRLIALFDRVLRSPSEPQLFGSLTRRQERALLTRHIAEWEAWSDNTLLPSATVGVTPDGGKSRRRPGGRKRPPDRVAPASSDGKLPLFETTTSAHAVVVLRSEIPDPESTGGVELHRYLKLRSPVPIGAPIPEAALDPLDRGFPQFAEVTQGVREEMRLGIALGAGRIRLRPRLLVGPPGTGKSRYLRALAEALRRPVRFLSAAAADGRALIGTARGWSSAVPSFPVTSIAVEHRADPMLVVDEVDKADRNHVQSNLQSGLLGLIEPATSAAWYDECLMAECDLSWIAWMLTANDTSTIAGPLANRCRIHRIGPPVPAFFDAYLGTIRGDIARELCVPIDALPDLDPVVHDALRRAFARNPSLRALNRAVRRVLAAAPRAMVH